MTKKLIKFDAPELNVIEKSKAEQIKATFEPMSKMLYEFEDSYNEIIVESEKEITKDLTIKAKRLRIDIGKVRINTDKLRVSQKEEYLRAGKAIDGVSNILKWAVADKENKLQEIEDYYDIQEKNRLQALQKERADQLIKYVDDAYERNLSDMEVDVWTAYLSSKKKEYDDKIEAEKKAELERIAKEKAEAQERQRIRKENEKLKKEAEEREKQYKHEAEKRAREEAELNAKLEAERKAREIKEAEEKAKREKVEAELNAKLEAERKAVEEEKNRKQLELNKNDSDKVKDLISDLTGIKNKYFYNSEKNKNMFKEVSILLDKVINYIEKT